MVSLSISSKPRNLMVLGNYHPMTCKWLIIIVRFRPLSKATWDPFQMALFWLIYLIFMGVIHSPLTFRPGMILQVVLFMAFCHKKGCFDTHPQPKSMHPTSREQQSLSKRLFQSPSPEKLLETHETNGKFSLCIKHLSHEKKPSYFPLYWLFNGTPYNGLL